MGNRPLEYSYVRYTVSRKREDISYEDGSQVG
jgi:hypothetical protein